MTAEPNPQDPAGAREDDTAGRHRSTLTHVDVVGSTPSRNTPLRWLIVIVPVLLIAVGGTYLVNLLTATMQQAPEARRANEPRPTPTKNTKNPVPAEDAARRASRETSGVGAGESGFDVEVVLGRLATADANAGASAFKMCVVCHSAERNAPHKLGPNLWGIVGARKAAFPDFRYSQALREKRGTWSYRELAEYLHDTRGAVPGTSMAFFGIKDNQRMADLLAYMRTRGDRPAPLPK